jgi:hypothetical protein
MNLALILVTHALLQSALIGQLPATREAADSNKSALRRDALSLSGVPGLVTVPVAATIPSGMIDFAFSNARTPSSYTGLGTQQSYVIAVGLLPRVSLSLRGTVFGRDANRTADCSCDLSENIQVQLLTEDGWRPAVAVGAQDPFSAAAYFKTRYLVASKSVLGRLRLTAGYGSGPTVLKGAFGGAELNLTSWASALGDYDGSRYNAALRLQPFPATAEWAGVQPRVDVVWRQGFGLSTAFGLRTSMGGNSATARERSVVTSTTARAARTDAENAPLVVSAGSSTSSSSAAKGVQAELVAQGFENVRAIIVHAGGAATMAVEYENRRYNRDELDALGIVMAVAAHYAADSVARIRVTILRREIPVLLVESGTAALTAFLDERGTPATFEQQLEIRDPGAGGARGGRELSVASSRFKLDIFARPRLETAVMTELGPLELRGSLLADAYVQLGRGIVLNARRTVGSAESAQFPGYLSDPNTDRLLLHLAAPLPAADRLGLAGALTQLSMGRFGHYEVGVAEEFDVPLADGLVSVGATVGVIGNSFQKLDRAVAFGVARVRHPALDLTTSVTAGRFRNGDVGAAVELGRFFGQTEFAVFAKSTRFASQSGSPFATQAGARISLPLVLARELAPSRVRLRLPDVYSQGLQAAVVKKGEFGAIRTDIGLLLNTDHEVGRAYRSRDRLQVVTIRQHVVALRDGAKRWYHASH